jgi:hypothetical protein
MVGDHAIQVQLRRDPPVAVTRELGADLADPLDQDGVLHRLGRRRRVKR